MNIAIIPAGGTGQNLFGEERPKQFLDLDGEPVIIHTLKRFEKNQQIDAIIIACVEGWIGYLQDALEEYQIRKVKRIVPGGRTGQLSIYNALCEAKELSGADNIIVLIHDAVRPLIDDSIINRNIQAVQEYGSAVTVAPIHETVLVTKDEETVADIPDKTDCKFAQAPQSFWLDDLLKLHERALREGKTDFVDSCTMMQYYHRSVHLLEGPQENIKITTQYDLYAVEGILKRIKEKETS